MTVTEIISYGYFQPKEHEGFRCVYDLNVRPHQYVITPKPLCPLLLLPPGVYTHTAEIFRGPDGVTGDGMLVVLCGSNRWYVFVRAACLLGYPCVAILTCSLRLPIVVFHRVLS